MYKGATPLKPGYDQMAGQKYKRSDRYRGADRLYFFR